MNLPRARRGSLLLLVAVLIVVCAMLGASVAVRVQTEGNLAQLRRRDDQLRAVAWSGVRVAMQALSDQREKVLAGEDLELPETAIVFEDDARGEQGIVAFEPAADAPQDDPTQPIIVRAVGQSSLLDVNLADAAMLVKLGCTPATAASVIAARPGGGYALADDVLAELSTADASTAAVPRQPGVPLPDPPTGIAAPGATPLATFIAASSWDCQQPSAASSGSSGIQKRLLLGGGIEDSLKAELDRLVSAAAKPQVEAMLTDAAWKGKKLADVVPALAAAGVAPRQIGAVLDVVSAQATAFPRGRVDLLRASPRVLATLEGIDAPLAERLTATRGSLDAASKADLAWPLSQGVLSTQQFAAIADKVTNRSLQWRIRVRASVDRLGGTTAAAMPTASGDQAPPVGMLLDAIIDCSGPTVRVVGMYEATWQAVASAVARERRVPEAEDAGATAEASLPVESAPPSGLNEESRRAKPRRPAAPPDMVSSRRARGGLRSEDSRVPPPVDDGSPIVEGSEPLPRADGSEPVRESPPGDSVGGRSGRWRPR